jgi:hypothetical protein
MRTNTLPATPATPSIVAALIAQVDDSFTTGVYGGAAVLIVDLLDQIAVGAYPVSDRAAQQAAQFWISTQTAFVRNCFL